MRNLALFLSLCFLMSSVAMAAEAPSPLSQLRAKAGGATKTAKSTSSKKPTMLTKMTTAPKRLITGTKNLLTPKKPPQKKTGVVAIRKAEKPQPPQQSWWGRTFNPKPAPPPSTVSEWMALEQVRPYGDTKPLR